MVFEYSLKNTSTYILTETHSSRTIGCTIFRVCLHLRNSITSVSVGVRNTRFNQPLPHSSTHIPLQTTVQGLSLLLQVELFLPLKRFIGSLTFLQFHEYIMMNIRGQHKTRQRQ